MPTKSFDRTIVLNGEAVDKIIACEKHTGILHTKDRERIESGKEALKKFQPQNRVDKSIQEKVL